MIELVVEPKESKNINVERLFGNAARGEAFTPYERDLLAKTAIESPDLVGTLSRDGKLPTSALSVFHGDIIFLKYLSENYGIIYDDGVSLFRRVPDGQVRLIQYHVSTSPNSRHGKFFGESRWQLLQTQRTLSGYVERTFKDNDIVRYAINLVHPQDADFVLYAALGNMFERTIDRVRKIK